MKYDGRAIDLHPITICISGNYSKAELARLMNVSPKTILNIVSGRIWKTV